MFTGWPVIRWMNLVEFDAWKVASTGIPVCMHWKATLASSPLISPTMM